MNDSITVIEGGIRYLEVSFLANDTDDDLENESAKVNVSSGSTVVSNNSCSSSSLNGNVVNYTCMIEIEYWYAPGSWDVSAEINDSSNVKAQNATSWDLQELKAMNVSLVSLTWPLVIQGYNNLTSDNDPIIMENTGNAVTLDIYVQGIDLYEDAAGATMIPAANFTVFNATDANDIECDSLNQTAAVSYGEQPIVLVNNTDMPVVLSALARGAGNQDNLYFCLFHVPSALTSATYSTGGRPDEEDWTISVQ